MIPRTTVKRFMTQTLSQSVRSLLRMRLDTPLRRIGEGEVTSERSEKELRAGCGGGSGGSSGSSGSGFLGGFRSGGSLAAALGLRRSGGRLTDELGYHNAGNEQLGTVIVEINRGTLLIGSGNNTQAVRFVLYCLTFCHHLHIILLDHVCVAETRSNLLGCSALEVEAPQCTG
jgi:hypothetical protein